MKKTVVALLFAMSSTAFASCNDLYPPNVALPTKGTTELCNSFYVSRYDEANKKVVFVSERLRQGMPVGTVVRENPFKADSRIRKSPKPNEYTHSGYDKGHMAPADDASTHDEMVETFYMTNMTPQEPTCNRIGWKMLEDKVRKIWDSSRNDVFVITMADYDVKPKTMSGIPIPRGYWKIVWADGRRIAFYAKNEEQCKVVQVESPIK